MDPSFELRRSIVRARTLASLAGLNRAWFAHAVAFGMMLALAAAVVGLNMRDHPKLSIFDEMVHFDYAYKISHGIGIRRGDRVGQQAMREQSCRGVDVRGYVPPPCHPPFVATSYPETGYNTAATNPPLYYLLTGLAARALHGARIVHDPLNAARAVGALWLALGLFLTWYVAGRLGAPPLSRALVVVLAATSGLLIHMSAIVNPDCSALAGGALALLTGLVFERTKRWWPLLVVTAGLVLTKDTVALALVPLVLYLAGRWWRSRGAATGYSPRYLGFGALAVLAVAAAAEAGWLLVVRWTAVPGVVFPMDRLFHQDRLSLLRVAEQIPAFVGTIGQSTDIPPFGFQSGAGVLVATLFNLLAVGACVSMLFHQPADDRLRTLGIATVFSLLMLGPLFTLGVFLLDHDFVDILGRFGLSLWPFPLVVLAASVRGVAARIALSVVTAASTLLALSALLNLTGWLQFSV